MVLAWASVNEGPSTSSRFTSVHVVLMLVYTHIHCHEVLAFLHLTEVLRFVLFCHFYLIETVAPASSNSLFNFSASSLEIPSLTLAGRDSTKPFASFNPSCKICRMTLMMPIFLPSPYSVMYTSNSVFSWTFSGS